MYIYIYEAVCYIFKKRVLNVGDQAYVSKQAQRSPRLLATITLSPVNIRLICSNVVGSSWYTVISIVYWDNHIHIPTTRKTLTLHRFLQYSLCTQLYIKDETTISDDHIFEKLTVIKHQWLRVNLYIYIYIYIYTVGIENEKEKERERKIVCVCVCVWEREREREMRERERERCK